MMTHLALLGSQSLQPMSSGNDLEESADQCATLLAFGCGGSSFLGARVPSPGKNAGFRLTGCPKASVFHVSVLGWKDKCYSINIDA